MSKEKGFLTPMTFGMLAGAALSVAAISMSDSRARRAVRKKAGRAADAVSDVVDGLERTMGR